MSRRPCPEPLQISLANQTPLPPSSTTMNSCCPHPAGPRKGRWTQNDTATGLGLCTHHLIPKGCLLRQTLACLLSLPHLSSLCVVSYIFSLAHSPQLTAACHPGPPQTVPAGKLALTSVVPTLFLDSLSHICLHLIITSWGH